MIAGAAPAVWIVCAAIAVLGLVVWTWRLRPVARLAAAERADASAIPADGSTRVSIIIPARDEAHNLPALLASIARLRPPPLEVIVVDDHSSDGTGEIARAAGARVVTPPPLPDGWMGKPWACRAGAAVATGDHLLFTDADTTHAPSSLAIALAAARRTGAGLVTAVPEHRAVTWWEHLQAPYHLLLLIATAAGRRTAGATPRQFSIGQYLLFRRDVYQAIGGHDGARRRVAEDLALAELVAATGAPVAVVVGGVVHVRMYPEGLGGFVRGWRRSFRDGQRAVGVGAALELTAVFGWLLGAPLGLLVAVILGGPALIAGTALVLAATAIEVGRRQHLVGRFPPWAALAYPFAALAFAVVSALAVIDRVRGAPVRWKSRTVASE